MAEIVFILGGTGTGKSRSTKHLDPNKTLIFDIGDKSLPFKNDWEDFNSKEKKGNLVHTSDIKIIYKVIDFCEKEMNFDTYVFDDFQFLMSYEFFERAKELGYQKFTDIGQKVYDLIKRLKALPKNKIVFILSHTEDVITNNVKETKMKTIGKMLDEKLTVESIATICLGTFVERELGKKKMNYYFITQNIGNATFKSPEDMFDELLIPNDLNYVAQKIKEYYPNKFKTN